MKFNWLIFKKSLVQSQFPSSSFFLCRFRDKLYLNTWKYRSAALLHRQTVHRRLSPLPWEVLSTQPASRLQPPVTGLRRYVRRGLRRRDPVAPFIPLRFPAAGRGPVEPRPPVVGVHLQEVPRQVLQVPQHPDQVPAASQPPSSWERKPEKPVSPSEKSHLIHL